MSEVKLPIPTQQEIDDSVIVKASPLKSISDMDSFYKSLTKYQKELCKEYQSTVLEKFDLALDQVAHPNMYEKVAILAQYFTISCIHKASEEVNIEWCFEQLGKFYSYFIENNLIENGLMGKPFMVDLAAYSTEFKSYFDLNNNILKYATSPFAYKDGQIHVEPLNYILSKKIDINANPNEVLCHKVFGLFVFPKRKITNSIIADGNYMGEKFFKAFNEAMGIPGFAPEGKISNFCDWYFLENKK